MEKTAADPAVPHALLAAAVDFMEHGVLLLDNQCVLVRTNAAFVALIGIGVPPQQLIGTLMPAGPWTFAHVYADPELAGKRGRAMIGSGRPWKNERHAMADGRMLAHDYRPVAEGGTTIGHLWLVREVPTSPCPGDAEPGRQHELTAAIAHEVRTPATAIAAFAEMLDDADVDQHGRHRAAAAVRRNAERMLLLASDLMLLAELETGTAPSGEQPVDPTALVRSAVETLGLPVTIEELSGPGARHPRVTGDKLLLRRAVDAVIGTVAAITGPAADNPSASRVTVRITTSHTEWSTTITVPTTQAVTTERLLAVRVPDHADPEISRTGAMALLLARAITADHGGETRTENTESSYSITLRLPMS